MNEKSEELYSVLADEETKLAALAEEGASRVRGVGCVKIRLNS